jgi:alpha-beta hydrolase superfamily lysophospholipase
MDLQGFGRSGGARGDLSGIRAPVEDLSLFLRQERMYDAQRAAPEPILVEGAPVPARFGRPQVLLGHSFGGLVALLVLLWHPDTLDALIASSPALKLRELPVHLKVLQKVMSWVAPHLILDVPGDKSKVCSDPVLLQRYEQDPLCHRFISAAFVSAMAEGRRELLRLGAELDRPILLLEAGEDVVVDPDGCEPLWAAIRPGVLERHRLDGFYHEIFHDRDRAEAERLAAQWLDRTFPMGAGVPVPLPGMLDRT